MASKIWILFKNVFDCMVRHVFAFYTIEILIRQPLSRSFKPDGERNVKNKGEKIASLGFAQKKRNFYRKLDDWFFGKWAYNNTHKLHTQHLRTETFACATVVDVSLCVMKRREKDERNHEVHQPHLSMQRSCLRKPSARVWHYPVPAPIHPADLSGTGYSPGKDFPGAVRQ